MVEDGQRALDDPDAQVQPEQEGPQRLLHLCRAGRLVVPHDGLMVWGKARSSTCVHGRLTARIDPCERRTGTMIWPG